MDSARAIVEPDFEGLFQQIPGFFVVLRPDFTIAGVSDAYATAARTTRDKMLNRGFFDLFPDETGKVRESLIKVLRHGVPDKMEPREYRINSGDRIETKYWSAVNSPIFSPQGELLFVIRRVDDVTVQVRNEGERKSLEAERDLFFFHSFDLIAIVGPDGFFKRINPAFERVMGYSEQELLSKPILEFLHPDDRPKTSRGIQKLASGQETVASINRYLCKDGKYRAFSWNTATIGTMFFTVGRDITEQLAAEEKIRDLNVQLEKKNSELEDKITERIADLNRSEDQVRQLQKMDAVGRLAGGIAHDFNNMLGAISLYCDILLENSDKPDSVREHVQDIVAATARAAALTRQLLVFSRKQILQFQTVPLNPLIQQMQKMLERLIGANVKIVTKFDETLRPINADPSQIEQVIMNLAVNARDAMPQGGVLSIETSNVYLDEQFTSTHLSVKPGPYVMLSISDTGTGMDAETLSKVFEPFFTTKEVGKGTGLGLTTTYGIIKQTKGTIWVYSEPGRGTIFKIYLPVATTVVVEPELVSNKEVPVADRFETILLVEDDNYLRSGFATMLTSRGYHVLVAANAKEALKFCETHSGSIDVLLTDVVMPGLSGIELAAKAREIRADLRVLFMSGYTDHEFAGEHASQLQEVAFIQKPFGTNALIAKVRQVLGHVGVNKS